MNFPQAFLRIMMTVLGIGVGLLTVRCTPGPQTTRFLVDQPDQAIGLEVTYREGAIEYSHPATLTPEVLDQILQHIEVQPSSLLNRLTGASAISQEAFTKEQRGFLATYLSTALNQATPLETATFYWATPRGNGIWEITSGGLYLQEHDLHMVFPNYRQTIPTKHPPQEPKNDPLSQLGEPLHSLKAVDPARQLAHSLSLQLWEPQTPHFVFSLKEFAHARMPFSRQQAKPSIPSTKSGASIKHRLQTLEELRQEGLLTETEYQRKRQEILDKL